MGNIIASFFKPNMSWNSDGWHQPRITLRLNEFLEESNNYFDLKRHVCNHKCMHTYFDMYMYACMSIYVCMQACSYVCL